MANPLATVAYNYMIAQLSVTLTYGLYLPIFMASFRILLRRAKKHSGPPKFLLLISTTVFCSTTTYFTVIMAQSLKWFSRLRGVDTEDTLDSLLSFIQSSWPLEVAAAATKSFIFTAGNAVLVWRASVLWKRYPYVQYMLWGLFSCQAAISASAVIYQAIVLANSDGRDVTTHMIVYTPAMFISMGVNLIATLFVVAQTWAYKKSLLRELKAFELLYLLVECGFCLCSIQLTDAVLMILRAHNSRHQWTYLPPEALSVAAPIVPFLVILAAICPCLIILLTARHENVMKAYTRSTSMMLSTRPNAMTEVHFVSKPPAQVLCESSEISEIGSTSDSAKVDTYNCDVEKMGSP